MQRCLEVKRVLLGILKIALVVVLVQMMAVVLGGDNNGGSVGSAVDFDGGGGGASVGWGFGGGKSRGSHAAPAVEWIIKHSRSPRVHFLRNHVRSIPPYQNSERNSKRKSR
ncbi:Hypothetical predicted protein [Prunus dulcis]|uniref:Uncharacterized protein n=1 Tax=Prunus dulcis TaxID=3755 RepID=A0A5E4EMZ7_PRUDU|nr:Hypothetical predicted protein [Prunus dulcis]